MIEHPPMDDADERFTREAFQAWWEAEGYKTADPESVWMAAVEWAKRWRWE